MTGATWPSPGTASPPFPPRTGLHTAGTLLRVAQLGFTGQVVEVDLTVALPRLLRRPISPVFVTAPAWPVTVTATAAVP